MRQLGVDCTVFKPFASGCRRENGALWSQDAEFLRQTLQLNETSAEICPIRLEEALAPLVAARRAGISTAHWPYVARDGLQHLRAKHEFVIVEGSGGLLAPLWETPNVGTNLDLRRELDLPAVLVARRTLGTINHTLLSLRCADFAGIIFNDAVPVARDDIAAQTSPGFIAESVAVPIWGQIPFALDLTISVLNELASALEIRF